KDEKESGAKKSPRRPAPEGKNRRADEHQQDQQRERHGRNARRHAEPIIEHERLRPDRELQVMDDRADLRQRIVPDGNGAAKSGRATAAPRANDKPDQRKPSRGEREVISPALAPGRL